MRIGLDAKRAFHNFTGLGNYSRTLIHDLAHYFPQHEYVLFNPKKSKNVSFSQPNIQEINPNQFFHRKLSSLWRSKWMLNDILAQKIELYHGLSHEIPYGIENTKVKNIVTIHDLIYERYPQQYKALDIAMYRQKYRFACKNATHIIAISEQTKRDIVELYQVPEHKISVCYQSCDPQYFATIDAATQLAVRQKYQLPERFLFSVGSIIERKNLLNICKSLNLMEDKIPLVVIGNGTGKYRAEINSYLKAHAMENQVIFLSEQFQQIAELPVLYALASAFIYPSIYEGFGIPVLEALSVGTPVITSAISCLPEAGGDAAYYVNPYDIENMAAQIEKALQFDNQRDERIAKGKIQAQKFSNRNCADAVMKVYEQVMARG